MAQFSSAPMFRSFCSFSVWLALLLAGFAWLVPSAQGRVPGSSVHLAARTDGRDGAGTRRDPRDASSAAKLDVLWSGLPAGARVRFGPGTFETRTGLLLKPGQRVLGRGPARTILRLADEAMPAGSYPLEAPLVRTLLRSESLDGNNHVAGLCLDGNREGQPAYVEGSTHSFVNAIALHGMNCSIRDVRYVNGFSRSDAEAFPILVEGSRGTFQRPARGRIERVVVEEIVGYNTAISLLAQTRAGADVSGAVANGVFTAAKPHGYAVGEEVIFVRCQGGAGIVEGTPYFVRDTTPTTFRVAASPGGAAVALRSDLSAAASFQPRRITGTIRGCVVRGWTKGPYSLTIAFGCGGWQRVTLRGNRTVGVATGVNTDTHCYRDVRIVGNRFGVRADPRGNQSFGVFLGGGYSWTRYRIERNTFVLSANSAALVLNGNVRGVSFRNNVIQGDGSPPHTRESISVRYAGNGDLRLSDNRVEAGTHFTKGEGVVQSAVNNRALDGAPLLNWPRVRNPSVSSRAVLPPNP